MISTLRIALALSAALATSACTDDVYPDRPDAQPAILGTIYSDPSLHTFLEATMIADQDNDLTDQLATPGAYTVFVPTNAAFDRLAVEMTGDPAALGQDLMTLDNQALLRSVVDYHVVAGQLVAADLPRDTPIITQHGAELSIAPGTPMVIVDARDRLATITATDVSASNGVVHVIDAVLLPPE